MPDHLGGHESRLISKLEGIGKRGGVHQGATEEVRLLVKSIISRDTRVGLKDTSFGLEELAHRRGRPVSHGELP